MNAAPDGQHGSNSSNDGGDGIGRKVAIALAFIPAVLITPLVVTGTALLGLWRDDKTRNIVGAAAWLLVAGTIIFMILEGLSLVDSFYFSFITLATIGFGDITPTTELGKIAVVVYGISGLGIMASLISAIASRPRSRHKRGRSANGEEVAA